MTIKVTAGSIMSRGMGGLGPSQFKELLDNSGKVDAIVKEIDERRTLAIEAEASAKERLIEADKAEAALAAREAALAAEATRLAAETAAAEAKQQGGAEALTKLTRQVSINEAACDKRALALDEREKKIAEDSRVREDELRFREAEIERAEKAIEKSQQDLQRQAKEAEETRARVDTAVSLIHKAVSGLR